jgi:hypothetical protein
MELFVYDTESNEVLLIVDGEDNAACEAKAAEEYSVDDVGWTYSPALGTNDGLQLTAETRRISA